VLCINSVENGPVFLTLLLHHEVQVGHNNVEILLEENTSTKYPVLSGIHVFSKCERHTNVLSWITFRYCWCDHKHIRSF